MEQYIISKRGYNVEYIKNNGDSRFMPADTFLYKKGYVSLMKAGIS